MLEALKRPLCRSAHRVKQVVSLVRAGLRQVPAHGGLYQVMLKGWRLYTQLGLRGLLRRIRALAGRRGAGSVAETAADYQEWVNRYDSWPAERLASLHEQVAAMPIQPRFIVTMPGASTGQRELVLAALKAQPYTQWLAEDAVASPTDADWVLVLYPGVQLAQHALLTLVAALNRQPDARLVYADEDLISAEGLRSGPDFKPDWNPLLFYSTGWLGSLYALPASVWQGCVEKVQHANAHASPELSWLQSLLLALEAVELRNIHHVARVLSHLPTEETQGGDAAGRSGGGAVGFPSAIPQPCQEGAGLLQAHFERIGVAAKVWVEEGCYRLRYEVAEPPLVSIVIPTRNGLQLMRQCLNSVFTLTTYPNYEIIIVDNGSDDEQALAYFAELARRPQVRVLRDDSPFNYSALNNMAVREARGEIIVLMNNDIEVISPDWLEEMVSFAMRPEVGAVGAKLLYPNDTVQHAGVILGIRGVAGHGHKNLKRQEAGYQRRAVLLQNLSAVTAACLAVRKSVWNEVGGLNEADLKVAFNDVDFCIRLVQAGYRNVWTPHAELYHHESVSRGAEDNPEKLARFAHEVRYMQAHWASVLFTDPAYNPGLTLEDEDFSLAWPPRWSADKWPT